MFPYTKRRSDYRAIFRHLIQKKKTKKKQKKKLNELIALLPFSKENNVNIVKYFLSNKTQLMLTKVPNVYFLKIRS